MYDKVAAYERSLKDHQRKLDSAFHSKEEHERRKKPCEKCQKGIDLGYGREWFCDYYGTLIERIYKYEREIESIKSNLYRAKREREQEQKTP